MPSPSRATFVVIVGLVGCASPSGDRLTAAQCGAYGNRPMLAEQHPADLAAAFQRQCNVAGRYEVKATLKRGGAACPPIQDQTVDLVPTDAGAGTCTQGAMNISIVQCEEGSGCAVDYDMRAQSSCTKKRSCTAHARGLTVTTASHLTFDRDGRKAWATLYVTSTNDADASISSECVYDVVYTRSLP